MKNAEDLENLDKLLDSSNKSYSDSKSKKSSLEINFLFRYGQFGSGVKETVRYLSTPDGHPKSYTCLDTCSVKFPYA